MKKLIVVSLFLIPSLSFAETISVTIRGMVCSFCAQGIEKNFKSESGVEEIFVNLDKDLVKVVTSKDKVLTDLKITSLIESAGFSVSKIERSK